MECLFGLTPHSIFLAGRAVVASFIQRHGDATVFAIGAAQMGRKGDPKVADAARRLVEVPGLSTADAMRLAGFEIQVRFEIFCSSFFCLISKFFQMCLLWLPYFCHLGPLTDRKTPPMDVRGHGRGINGAGGSDFGAGDGDVPVIGDVGAVSVTSILYDDNVLHTAVDQGLAHPRRR